MTARAIAPVPLAVVATALLLGVIAVVVYFIVRNWRWALLGVCSAAGLLVLGGDLRERFWSR